MPVERWQQIEDLYRAVCASDVHGRTELLARADPEVRREVESLLAHKREVGLFDGAAVDLLEDGSVPPHSGANTFPAGTAIGAYQIVARLGAGGMGVVYRAQDTRLCRDVALKVLPCHSGGGTRRQRFQREARAIAALNHPHICTLHDVGHELVRLPEGDVEVDFLVMEYVEGDTLAERLKHEPLPIERVRQYGIEIAEALDKAHRQGIVHRDLKPANIMVTKAGVKLLDFGLARLTMPVIAPLGALHGHGSDVALTGDGVILGTWQYMAPEQLAGQEADARADIFALGAVLYEMVTGRRAFDAPDRAGLIAAIVEHEPTSIRELRPLSPPALDHVIRECLAKSPDDRWQSAHDVMKSLRWITNESPSAEPSRSATRSTRARLAWGVAAALGIGLALGLAVAPRFLPATHSSNEARFEIATPPMPLPPSLSISPDGRRIAFVAVAASGIPALFVRPLNSAGAQPLPGTERAMLPFWSPDSRSIGFAADGKLKRIDPSGGPPITLCEIPDFYGGTWNADGVILFSVGYQPLMRVSASGGTPEAITRLDAGRGEAGHGWPFFLPDGRHFLYLGGGRTVDDRAIYVGSLDSPDSTRLVHANTRPMYASGHLLFSRGATLFAQRFDVDRLALRGDATRIADGVAFFAVPAGSAYGVSNSGTLVYRTATVLEETRLVSYDRSGNVLETIGVPGIYRTVALSPDDSRIAVHLHQEPEGGDVWVIDRSRGTFTRLTFTGHNASPVWSRDGASVFFSSERGNRPFDLYRTGANGVGSEELVLSSDRAIYAEDIAPDGRSFVYAKGGGPGAGIDIWSLPLDDRATTPREVIRTTFGERMAKLSSDGRWIAYESNESGRFEIYVQPYLHGTGKWQISTDGGRYARWARSGREIFYLKDDGTLMAVDVSGNAATFKAGTVHVLFKANPVFAGHPNTTAGPGIDIPYDVTRDGQRFVFTERIGNASQPIPISVVLNWTAALEK